MISRIFLLDWTSFHKNILTFAFEKGMFQSVLKKTEKYSLDST